jgi:uracil phosphoribosyltransferase
LKRIKFLCILASKDGLRALREAHPDIEIFVAAVDNELNDNGYVLPGLGDSGDRYASIILLLLFFHIIINNLARYFKTPHQ